MPVELVYANDYYVMLKSSHNYIIARKEHVHRFAWMFNVSPGRAIVATDSFKTALDIYRKMS